jgi:hypothetical protein
LDFKLGEPREARFCSMTLARQQPGGAAVAGQADYPENLQAYVLRGQGRRDPGGCIRRSQRAVLGLEPDLAGFADWAGTAQVATSCGACARWLVPMSLPRSAVRQRCRGLSGFWGLMPLGSLLRRWFRRTCSTTAALSMQFFGRCADP